MNHDSIRRTAGAARRRTHLFRGLGLAGATLSGLALFLSARVGRAPPPADASFRVESGRVVSAPLGFTLVLPAPWVKLAVVAQPGADVALEHPDGVRFV